MEGASWNLFTLIEFLPTVSVVPSLTTISLLCLMLPVQGSSLVYRVPDPCGSGVQSQHSITSNLLLQNKTDTKRNLDRWQRRMCCPSPCAPRQRERAHCPFCFSVLEMQQCHNRYFHNFFYWLGRQDVNFETNTRWHITRVLLRSESCPFSRIS